jgi:hypothetical protein
MSNLKGQRVDAAHNNRSIAVLGKSTRATAQYENAGATPHLQNLGAPKDGASPLLGCI